MPRQKSRRARRVSSAATAVAAEFGPYWYLLSISNTAQLGIFIGNWSADDDWRVYSQLEEALPLCLEAVA